MGIFEVRCHSRHCSKSFYKTISYDYQLSKARREFGDQVLMFMFCCCHGQLALFPAATCRPLTSFASETRIVASGRHRRNFNIRPTLRHQSSVALYSTDKRSKVTQFLTTTGWSKHYTNLSCMTQSQWITGLIRTHVGTM